MRAMMATQWCEPADLKLTELPDPTPGAGQVLIDVHAAGCNFADILMVQGKYQVRPPLPFAPGAEVAGVVRAIGPGVDTCAPGDRVFAMLPWGGFADVAVAPAATVVRMPDQMSFEHGAGFGVVYQTSYFALAYRADLQPGETLLVHAAAGGVGLAAVQIGKAFGARVLGTAGSAEKCELARQHGCDEVYDYNSADWVEQVKAATGGRGADVIYDPVGGDIFDLSTKCIAFGGRLLIIGFASGRIPTIQLNRVLLKNISLVGLHWGAYSQHQPERVHQATRELFALYERGQIRPLVSATYPLEQAAAALEAIGSRATVGKVVVVP